MLYYCPRCHEQFALAAMTLVKDGKLEYYVCKPCKNKKALPMPELE